MKLLHIISSVNPAAGGPIEGLRRQDEICRTMGLDVTRELVTLDPIGSPFLNEIAMPVHALGLPKRGRSLLGRALDHYGYTPNLVPWLRQNIHRYDAAVVHGLWNYAPFGASRVLPSGSTPYFVFPHGMMDPWFRNTYPLKHLAKQLFWLVGEGRLLAGARKVLFTAQDERQLAEGQFPLWRYRAEVVGYGTARPPPEMPEQQAAFDEAVPSLRGRPYLLFLSRIHRKKGCDLLVEAFAKVFASSPDFQLVIAGPDEEGLTDNLKARAEALGIGDRIHWPGMLRGSAKWGGFRGATAFVLPSHQENFGIVVAEALACGRPVLITDKVNIWREIESAKAGIVRSDDQAGVEDLLKSWKLLSLAEQAEMQGAAKRLFSEQFDLEEIAPAIVRTIRGAI